MLEYELSTKTPSSYDTLPQKNLAKKLAFTIILLPQLNILTKTSSLHNNTKP